MLKEEKVNPAVSHCEGGMDVRNACRLNVTGTEAVHRLEVEFMASSAGINF